MSSAKWREKRRPLCYLSLMSRLLTTRVRAWTNNNMYCFMWRCLPIPNSLIRTAWHYINVTSQLRWLYSPGNSIAQLGQKRIKHHSSTSIAICERSRQEDSHHKGQILRENDSMSRGHHGRWPQSLGWMLFLLVPGLLIQPHTSTVEVQECN